MRIGHRGAAGYEPENTLRSFARALECRVDMIELDVQVCGSGELVVIHDDTVERTTGGAGVVSELALAELKTLDAGKGEKIPALSEVIDAVNRRARLNIELKGAGAMQLVLDMLARYCCSGWTYNDFLISSFNHLDLWKIKEINPAVETSALIVDAPLSFDECAEELRVFSVNARHEAVTPAFAENLHRRGIKLFAYTVNEPARIADLCRQGVDGIFSDYPDRV